MVIFAIAKLSCFRLSSRETVSVSVAAWQTVVGYGPGVRPRVYGILIQVTSDGRFTREKNDYIRLDSLLLSDPAQIGYEYG